MYFYFTVKPSLYERCNEYDKKEKGKDAEGNNDECDILTIVSVDALGVFGVARGIVEVYAARITTPNRLGHQYSW